MNEKNRIKVIRRYFDILDAIIGVLIVTGFLILTMKFQTMSFYDPRRAYGIFEGIFVLLFGSILAFTAYILSSSVKRLTGKE